MKLFFTSAGVYILEIAKLERGGWLQRDMAARDGQQRRVTVTGGPRRATAVSSTGPYLAV